MATCGLRRSMALCASMARGPRCFPGKNTAGLPAVPKVNRLHADARGLLWGATAEGRFFSYDQTAWREYGAAEGWPGLLVEGITESAAGRLIFSGAKSVLEFAGGRFSPVALPELPEDFRAPLRATFDRDGKLWLTSPSHVWREEGGGLEARGRGDESQHLLSRSGTGARQAGCGSQRARELRRYVNDAPDGHARAPRGFSQRPRRDARRFSRQSLGRRRQQRLAHLDGRWARDDGQHERGGFVRAGHLPFRRSRTQHPRRHRRCRRRTFQAASVWRLVWAPRRTLRARS